jgi:cation transport ATPase
VATASLNGKPHARLEHRSPGRVRARVPKGERNPVRMQEIQDELAQHPNVRHVEVNSATGSVLVTGEGTHRLQSALADVLTLIESAAQEESQEAGVDATVQLVKTADQKLRGLTNGRFSLRALVPATFITLGVRQLLRQGLSIGVVPWYVLVYYGVDSFLKLYPHYAPQREDTVVAK